ncbi:hypothetical protein Acav_0657 [Paracidovorax avenae ATCC 19860]|uniref:Uncharacterized protein n=1 Tax=Paracidovorax avenae (strain ATCC 19860 / DSM 7227 / CCUG 15838 / JCM 20985 / LMG 2117 / NCPPB 1011) TaxID=643561 RepID=F0Q721_PARA1|nr:hypothetical protein Acav_0657 [Paracidovorax avenae ATCC 19860]
MSIGVRTHYRQIRRGLNFFYALRNLAITQHSGSNTKPFFFASGSQPGALAWRSTPGAWQTRASGFFAAKVFSISAMDCASLAR